MVESISFSPDGRRIASASLSPGRTGEVKIWDTATYQELLTLKDPAYSIDGVSFSPDGRRLFGGVTSFGQSRKLLHIWDATPPPEKSAKGAQ
jgi:WD40 repeat protein